MTDIVFIQIGQYASSPRLLKEHDLLKQNRSTNLLMWNISNSNLPSSENISYLNFSPAKGLLRRLGFFVWFFFCVSRLIQLKPKAIHAVDLDGAMIGIIYRTFRPSVKLVCDINDPTADRYSLTPNSIVRRLLISWERFLISKADAILVTNDAVIEQLGLDQSASKKTSVIYNSVPFKNSNKISCIPVSIKGKTIKAIYVGTLHKNIRGLEMCINAARKLPYLNLTIAGFGPDEDYFYHLPVPANVTILKRVSYGKALKLMEKNDLVLSLLDPSFQNYRYALSGKIFDSFKAGKPVITTAKTPSGRLVDETRWGIAIPYEEEALLKIIRMIHEGTLEFALDKTKIRKYDWAISGEKLKDVYKKLLD